MSKELSMVCYTKDNFKFTVPDNVFYTQKDEKFQDLTIETRKILKDMVFHWELGLCDILTMLG